MSASAPVPGEALDPGRLDPLRTGNFRFRRLGSKYLLTNDFGRYFFLGESDFRLFVEGKIDQGSPLYAGLSQGGFIRDRMDFNKLVEVWRSRNRFLWQAPSLHVVVVTLRCNHRCLYCHANSVSMKEHDRDMTLETAEKVVDRIFESPSPAITIEFQGGEPLANWPVVEFIVNHAKRKNLQARKELWLNLVTNLSLLDKEKLDFLLTNGVNFCTSLDGPADLHDANRVHVGGSSHAIALRWHKEISRRTRGKAFRIDALLTVTKFSLGRAREIVDEYLKIGSRGVFLRPLNAFGLARRTWDRIGYTPDEFLAFYREALDAVLRANRGGKIFFEQTAKLFLAKILTDEDPNFLDLRSPCGAGVGQIAYNFDGGIYTCDEGRMLSRMGDESFRIGGAAEGSYKESVGHPVVRTISVASCLDNQVDCSRCAYKPYCGVCPIQCYAEQGDVFGRMPTNTRCRIHKGIQDALFERIEDKRNLRIFRSWLKPRKPGLLYQR